MLLPTSRNRPLTVAAEEHFAEAPADDAQDAEETSAQELADGLMSVQETEEAADEGHEEEETQTPKGGESAKAPEAESEADRLERYKQGISTLLEDGWTAEELQAFSQDAAVHENLSRGMTLRQAARAYLMAGREEKPEARPRKRGVPLARQTAMGAAESGDMIASMTDAQFREFSRRAEAAMMAGKKVRFD